MPLENSVEYRCYLAPDRSVDILGLLKDVKGLHSREAAANILRQYRKNFRLEYGTYETGEPGSAQPVLRTNQQLKDFWSCLTKDRRKKAPLPDPNPALHLVLERHFLLFPSAGIPSSDHETKRPKKRQKREGLPSSPVTDKAMAPVPECSGGAKAKVAAEPGASPLRLDTTANVSGLFVPSSAVKPPCAILTATLALLSHIAAQKLLPEDVQQEPPLVHHSKPRSLSMLGDIQSQGTEPDAIAGPLQMEATTTSPLHDLPSADQEIAGEERDAQSCDRHIHLDHSGPALGGQRAAGSRAYEKEEDTNSIVDEAGPGYPIPASTIVSVPLDAKPDLSESDLTLNSPEGTEALAESFAYKKRKIELDDDELEDLRVFAGKAAAEELARPSAWTAVHGEELPEEGGNTGAKRSGIKACSGTFNTISNPFYHPRYYNGKKKVVLRTLKKVPGKEGAADGEDGSSCSNEISGRSLASSAAASKAFVALLDNIRCNTHILGFHRDQRVLVLPHFKHGDLGERIRSPAEGVDAASWPPGDCMDCALKLLKGGAESLLAQGEGNVFFHGDIKPSNILISDDSLTPVLCDHGQNSMAIPYQAGDFPRTADDDNDQGGFSGKVLDLDLDSSRVIQKQDLGSVLTSSQTDVNQQGGSASAKPLLEHLPPPPLIPEATKQMAALAQDRDASTHSVQLTRSGSGRAVPVQDGTEDCKATVAPCQKWRGPRTLKAAGCIRLSPSAPEFLTEQAGIGGSEVVGRSEGGMPRAQIITPAPSARLLSVSGGERLLSGRRDFLGQILAKALAKQAARDVHRSAPASPIDSTAVINKQCFRDSVPVLPADIISIDEPLKAQLHEVIVSKGADISSCNSYTSPHPSSCIAKNMFCQFGIPCHFFGTFSHVHKVVLESVWGNVLVAYRSMKTDTLNKNGPTWDAALRDCFNDEVRARLLLHGEGGLSFVCTLLAIGAEDLSLVERWSHGLTFRARLEQADGKTHLHDAVFPLSSLSRISLARQLLDMAAHLLRLRLIHGDISDCNIHIEEDGASDPVLKLLDFGSAVVAAPDRNRLFGGPDEPEVWSKMGTGTPPFLPHFDSDAKIHGIFEKNCHLRSFSRDLYGVGVLILELFVRPCRLTDGGYGVRATGNLLSARLLARINSISPGFIKAEFSKRMPCGSTEPGVHIVTRFLSEVQAFDDIKAKGGDGSFPVHTVFKERLEDMLDDDESDDSSAKRDRHLARGMALQAFLRAVLTKCCSFSTAVRKSCLPELIAKINDLERLMKN